MRSDLPPGCNSADGGIDHEYEVLVEELCEIATETEDMQLIRTLAPEICRIRKMAWREGFHAGRDEEKHTSEQFYDLWLDAENRLRKLEKNQ